MYTLQAPQKKPTNIPAGNIAPSLARPRAPALAAASPRPVVDHHLAVADAPDVHALSTGVRGDEQRGDLGLVVLAQYGRGCSIELRALLRSEADLVAAAVAFLELLEQVDPLFLQVPDVRWRQQRRRWGRRLDAGDHALDGVASRRRRAVVLVQLTVAEHAALVVVVAGPAALAELVVAAKRARRWLAVVAVVVGVLVRAPTATRHRRWVGRARARCTAAARRAGVTRRSRPRWRLVTGEPAARVRHRHPGVETATLPPGRSPSNKRVYLLYFVVPRVLRERCAGYVKTGRGIVVQLLSSVFNMFQSGYCTAVDDSSVCM